MNKIILQIIISLIVGCFSLVCSAEIAVVVHPSNTSADMSDNQVAQLFLAKKRSFPGGGKAIPISQAKGSPVRELFNKKVLKKSEGKLKAYWSKIVFTGKGSPPKTMENDAEVKKLVADNPNIIGYIDAKSVDDTVKVVLTIP
ncbi:MAG: phosphate ABC transporter substrate-binding protein [Gammaproteobacteria bacterium]|nr:MAG: phosphate ABC transporter substrate-binding protein [Gammaproteobacteria bacterium]